LYTDTDLNVMCVVVKYGPILAWYFTALFPAVFMDYNYHCSVILIGDALL